MARVSSVACGAVPACFITLAPGVRVRSRRREDRRAALRSPRGPHRGAGSRGGPLPRPRLCGESPRPSLSSEPLDVLAPEDPMTVSEADRNERALVGETSSVFLGQLQDPRGFPKGDELAR